MKRRKFIKNTGLGAGNLLAGISAVSFLESCGKNHMKNGIGMNMGGQPVSVKKGSFSRPLPVPNTVTGNATLTAQATTATINGSNIPVLGYQSKVYWGLLSALTAA